MIVMVTIRVLRNSITGGANMGDLGRQVDFAVLVIVAVVGTLRHRGERLASLDQICDDRSMGSDAAAAGPLGVAFHFAFAALAASLIALERNYGLLTVPVMSYT